jgi:hypothetical protein
MPMECLSRRNPLVDGEAFLPQLGRNSDIDARRSDMNKKRGTRRLCI